MSATPRSELGAAVIGSGFIGTVHIEALRRIGVQVRGVLGSTPERAAARATQLGVGHAYPDLDALLADGSVDVVHVTSPNHLHHPQVRQILAAGKHVVCEKPLAMTSRESAELVELAGASGRVNATNFNIRFYPLNQHLHEAIGGGDLGAVRLVTGHYFQDWLFHDTDYNWRLLPKEGGKLRALADIGTHWLDAASFVLGDHPAEVLADLGIHHKKRKRPLGEVKTFGGKNDGGRWQSYTVETEDFASVLLHYAGGTHGTLSVSQVAAGRKNQLRIEIYGAKQSAWWDSESPEQLHFGHRDTANHVAIRAAAGFSREEVRPFMDYPPGHVEGFPDSFKMQFRAIYTKIAGGKGAPLFATVEDGDMEVRLCEAILKSHTSRRWTPVTSGGRRR